ncbi:glycoside hydrolase family 3 N-terminal domain-containing protein [Crocosphaera sp. UHCC 0190]|uniref:glycoside hydrolase family 3 N-terminal domain-containing protein n=1 Tax=Crocosphaera sp. UHCC 0190 TaxID=3110246 RepID=UPI002B218BAE|nr:glycoside hydrolase family 3 N-terminal domain-containing protein [Crocosphaera sp. UHCC 0190]MEA5508139.1 glycoside hydrolase family 3 N-terminal domain-containing protein [Crocosphaera sp. UHCC 0190]
MIVVRGSGYLFDHQIRYPVWEASNPVLQRWLETLNLGGVILLGGSGAELLLRTQQLQEWSKTPLFIAADIEEGVGQRFSGATWFPPPMALGEIAKNDLDLGISYAQEMGKITAHEALSIGINWLLTPVVDVNNNPDNPVINIRSFGDTPDIVSALVTAFIEGAKNYPALTTAKHFPGHGDTVSDSHLNLPIINHDNERLESLELMPFQAAIEAKVDSVMTAHLLINAWDNENPATLSKPILTGKLREKLGFEGLIVTDALVMGGVANFADAEEVAVKAVEAGADVLLMPDDPEKAINAVYNAVESGRLTRERIEASVRRIWQAKQKIFNQEKPDLSIYNLSQPTARQTVKNILKYSLKTNNKTLEKVSSNTPKRNLIVVDDLLNADFLDRQMPGVIIPKYLGYDLQLVDQNTLDNVLDDNRSTLLQIFLRGNPFRGSAGFNENSKSFYHNLLKKSIVHGLIIYGSPYILDWFKTQINEELSWVFSYGQMAESQAIACQILFNLSASELGNISESLGDVFI